IQKSRTQRQRNDSRSVDLPMLGGQSRHVMTQLSKFQIRIRLHRPSLLVWLRGDLESPFRQCTKAIDRSSRIRFRELGQHEMREESDSVVVEVGVAIRVLVTEGIQ